MGPVIGIDFDNTIVAYDQLFFTLALERELVDIDCTPTKQGVRDLLREAGREEEWTELQGHAYGPSMAEAQPFPGALEFIDECITSSLKVAIISHRTRYPYAGEPFDLHAYARGWLTQHHVDCPAYFELTKEDKTRRISREECTHFIDDLPEFLSLVDSPPGIVRIHFDPTCSDRAAARGDYRLATSWSEIRCLVLDDVTAS